uniref:Uncharacterized protein n=1 Tax=Sipha flava TaxID=143950 RepID=A0A2S2QL50_9HEMI
MDMHFGTLLDLDRGQHDDIKPTTATAATSTSTTIGGVPTTVIVSSGSSSHSTLSDLPSAVTGYQHQQQSSSPTDATDANVMMTHATSGAQLSAATVNGYDHMMNGYGYCNTFDPYYAQHGFGGSLPSYTGEYFFPCHLSFSSQDR